MDKLTRAINEFDDAPSMYDLARLTWLDRSSSASILSATAESVRLYARASAQRYPDAMWKYAVCLFNSIGTGRARPPRVHRKVATTVSDDEVHVEDAKKELPPLPVPPNSETAAIALKLAADAYGAGASTLARLSNGIVIVEDDAHAQLLRALYDRCVRSRSISSRAGFAPSSSPATSQSALILPPSDSSAPSLTATHSLAHITSPMPAHLSSVDDLSIPLCRTVSLQASFVDDSLLPSFLQHADNIVCSRNEACQDLCAACLNHRPLLTCLARVWTVDFSFLSDGATGLQELFDTMRQLNGARFTVLPNVSVGCMRAIVSLLVRATRPVADVAPSPSDRVVPLARFELHAAAQDNRQASVMWTLEAHPNRVIVWPETVVIADAPLFATEVGNALLHDLGRPYCSVRELTLKRAMCPPYDAFLRAMQANESLVYLDLTGNMIPARVFSRLCTAVCALPTLITLILDSCDITSKQSDELAIAVLHSNRSCLQRISLLWNSNILQLGKWLTVLQSDPSSTLRSTLTSFAIKSESCDFPALLHAVCRHPTLSDLVVHSRSSRPNDLALKHTASEFETSTADALLHFLANNRTVTRLVCTCTSVFLESEFADRAAVAGAKNGVLCVVQLQLADGAMAIRPSLRQSLQRNRSRTRTWLRIALQVAFVRAHRDARAVLWGALSSHLVSDIVDMTMQAHERRDRT